MLLEISTNLKANFSVERSIYCAIMDGFVENKTKNKFWICSCNFRKYSFSFERTNSFYFYTCTRTLLDFHREAGVELHRTNFNVNDNIFFDKIDFLICLESCSNDRRINDCVELEGQANRFAEFNEFKLKGGKKTTDKCAVVMATKPNSSPLTRNAEQINSVRLLDSNICQKKKKKQMKICLEHMAQ